MDHPVPVKGAQWGNGAHFNICPHIIHVEMGNVQKSQRGEGTGRKNPSNQNKTSQIRYQNFLLIQLKDNR